MLLRLLIVCGLLGWQPSFAVDVKGLFQTEVIALSQEPEDRHAAIHEALMTVLQRVLVGDNISADPRVQSTLGKASSFIKHERYSLVENEYAGNTLARVMHIEFDGTALLDFLKSSQLRTWNAVRPETLVWLVVDDQGEKRLFKSSDMPELSNHIQKASQQQGLPLKFPRSGVKEERHISVDQAFSPNADQLLKISAGYHATSILAGQLVNREWCWESEWTLYFNHNTWQWKGDCNPMSEAVLEGVHGAYDKLSRYYSANPYNNCNISKDGLGCIQQLNQVKKRATAPLTKKRGLTSHHDKTVENHTPTISRRSRRNISTSTDRSRRAFEKTPKGYSEKSKAVAATDTMKATIMKKQPLEDGPKEVKTPDTKKPMLEDIPSSMKITDTVKAPPPTHSLEKE
ncbi:MAG: DUF2066 domain-containing protein [Methylovulum sp.]|nr:DUF2066 domain-containing protein [Methylovulum sp.]